MTRVPLPELNTAKSRHDGTTVVAIAPEAGAFAYLVPRRVARRSELLLQLLDGHEDDGCRAPNGRRHVVVIPIAASFPAADVAVFARYANLPERTLREAIAPQAANFAASISPCEVQFLASLVDVDDDAGGVPLPMAEPGGGIGRVLRAMAFADFLQCRDMATLLAGFLATRMLGLPMLAMRQLLYPQLAEAESMTIARCCLRDGSEVEFFPPDTTARMLREVSAWGLDDAFGDDVIHPDA
jgi:hypothetical protein